MKSYYLDHNATTPVAEEVFQAMRPCLVEHFGNPSSLHRFGAGPARILREARRQVASFLGAASEKEIVFTSCGSESNNTAIRSALRTTGRKRFITSSVEHSSVKKLAAQLEKEGYDVVLIGVDADGRLDRDELIQAATDETALVSLMAANNETGVLFPIEEVGDLLHKRGILFHVDAVQAAGKMPLVLKDLPVDFASFSAHKIYGPKGVGALYVKDGVEYHSLVIGGAQERGRRAGTENIAGISGFARACELVAENSEAERERLEGLRNFFEEEVVRNCEGSFINGLKAPRLANTSNIFFPDVEGEAFLMALDQEGIAASGGSACMSGAGEPSHVLKAMGLPDHQAKASLRFSMGRFTTEKDVRDAVRITLSVWQRLARQTKSRHGKAVI